MISTAVKAVIALVVVGGLLFYLDSTGSIDLGLASTTSTTTTTPTNLTPGSFDGLLDVNVNIFDSATQELLDTTTELDINVYDRASSEGLIGVYGEELAGAMDLDLAINPATPILYFEVLTDANEATPGHYIDIAKTEAQSKVLGHQFLDLNNDGTRGVIFEVDVTGHKETAGFMPQQTLTIYMIDEGNFAMTALADVTGLGDSGKVACRAKWSADMDNSGDGELISRIRLVINATAGETGVFLSDSNIIVPLGPAPNSATEKIFLSQMDETQLSATSFQYDYDIGSNFEDSRLWLSPLNGETDFEIPLELFLDMNQVTFESDVEINLRTVNAENAFTTATDSAFQCQD